jgi:hypothetical protein
MVIQISFHIEIIQAFAQKSRLLCNPLQNSRIAIFNPVGKTKSVAFSESGLRESQRLLAELFTAADGKG